MIHVQGLRWLLGLYDNNLNGILADEMVGTGVLTASLITLHSGLC